MAKLTNKLIDSLKANNQNYIVWDDEVDLIYKSIISENPSILEAK